MQIKLKSCVTLFIAYMFINKFLMLFFTEWFLIQRGFTTPLKKFPPPKEVNKSVKFHYYPHPLRGIIVIYLGVRSIGKSGFRF